MISSLLLITSRKIKESIKEMNLHFIFVRIMTVAHIRSGNLEPGYSRHFFDKVTIQALSYFTFVPFFSFLSYSFEHFLSVQLFEFRSHHQRVNCSPDCYICVSLWRRKKRKKV